MIRRKAALLRVRDVAMELGISRSRVYRLITAGAIPATRVGGSIRIPREAWNEWLSEHRRIALAAVRSDGGDNKS
jgi:excisionase family DNA binding protein